MLKEMTQSDRPYLRVVGGNFVQKVEEGTQGAVLRKWKAPDGTEGETLEKVYMEWEGIIRNVSIKANDYGEVCVIEGDDVTITLATDSRYFTDFASKLFNISLKDSVILHPYDFESDGKKKRGVSVTQNEEKVTSYFYDGKDNCNGFPVVDDARKDINGYWKIYFAEITMFLTEKLKEIKFPERKEEPVTQPVAQPTQVPAGNAANINQIVESPPMTEPAPLPKFD